MNQGTAKITYPWYAEVAASALLEQGDFIRKCQIIHPVIEAQAKNQTITAEVVEYDVIIMSQSCDLIANKIDLVLVCPFYLLSQLEKLQPDYRNADMKEKLRKGQVIGLHLLNNPAKDNMNDFLIVDFKSVYAVPLSFLKQITLSRVDHIRLLPPYREHLSQSFARFFMRVGLPVDIPPFK